ncbi:phosphoenolpyruvate carboxylase [Flavobacteriaceae bacterium]|nr:phosphoenolpyruvate carboxylase [Flavobacteriaceae bacterium]MDA9294350.1 phosphoenolpyruvate carboxylase [Flavobacteriaceae bacterium]MDC1402103.1 phosphoenolpyruvate carboxylase [Flavobacteriaceae bacterium]
MARKTKLERFNDNVLSKFEIYNSLFLTLPFDSIAQSSLYLPLFSDHCKKGFEQKKSPLEIIQGFVSVYGNELSEKEIQNLLFGFIQYIERQVVLFDAIEDAAFADVNNMHGRGTIRYIKEETIGRGKTEELKDYLNRFNVRIVLTAHPTQFYPGSVLGIINDLSEAIKLGNLEQIKKLLMQLGKTRFFNKAKPSPFDEAVSLLWFLENVFYHSASRIYGYIQEHILEGEEIDNTLFNFGFWPGGDRDGNPFVTPEISLQTANRLRYSIQRNYYRDLRRLKRKITFDEVDERISFLEEGMYSTLLYPEQGGKISLSFLIAELKAIKAILIERHNGIYVNEINDLYNKVKLFGYHFASLDIRQDSRVHQNVFDTIISHPDIQQYVENLPENYSELLIEERIQILPKLKGNVPTDIFTHELTKHTLGSIYAMKEIQAMNGERSCNRYIISNCGSLESILQLFAMHHLCDWNDPTVDIIPLFETVDDLLAAEEIMQKLYSNEAYRAHLEKRKNKQTIMLGFSDGTKDGGYIMANWSIYKAKEMLSEVSKSFGIEVAFFDGRGGPPARGGGNTHQFYASLGEKISANDIQITIQGQTISSNFGTQESSQFNLEQLLSSGIQNQVLEGRRITLSDSDRATLEQLADLSYEKYKAFKSHPQFVPYIEHMSTLKYYAKTNIGSRPSKRGNAEGLNFSDLRAIPFVGSWSQSKQNVPGFFGVGTSLKHYEDAGEFDKVIALYNNSPFFKTLVANSMMSLSKSFFGLTAYMENDPVYGAFWSIIHDEYLLSKRLLLKLSGFETLMEDQPAGKKSIDLREQIVLPLLTIQQYGLMKIQELLKAGDLDEESRLIYEKLVTRSLFGNINASRNSA